MSSLFVVCAAALLWGWNGRAAWRPLSGRWLLPLSVSALGGIWLYDGVVLARQVRAANAEYGSRSVQEARSESARLLPGDAVVPWPPLLRKAVSSDSSVYWDAWDDAQLEGMEDPLTDDSDLGCVLGRRTSWSLSGGRGDATSSSTSSVKSEWYVTPPDAPDEDIDAAIGPFASAATRDETGRRSGVRRLLSWLSRRDDADQPPRKMVRFS